MQFIPAQLWRTALAAALVAEALAIPCAMRALAQDPFAPAAPGAAKAPADDPFGKAAADPAKAAAKSTADVEAEAIKAEPLAIQQFRESNPTTPDQIVRAAHAVLQFGRPDESKQYLARLVAAKPDDAALAALEKKFGAGLFLRFSQVPELQPEGKRVGDMVLDAAQKMARETAVVDLAIKQLNDPDPYVQGAAVAKLKDAGPSVVTPMLRALSDAGRETEHKQIRGALVAMAGISEPPLLGALETPNDYLRPQVIAILGKMQSRAAVKFLLRPAADPKAPPLERQLAQASLARILGNTPSLYDAEKYLFDSVDRLLTETPPFETNADGQTEIWYWDATQNTTLPRSLPAHDAALLLAARLADDLFALSPQKPEIASLRLLRKLELAQVLTGLDKPLVASDPIHAVAQAAGPQLLGDVLDQALRDGRTAAAIAGAQLLGEIGDESLLRASATQESPLARCLIHGDRRVRFRAAQAIMKLDPRESFPGASRLPQTLGWIAGASGTSRVLVGHPKSEEAQTLIGFMIELGYEGDPAYSGRLLMEQAVANPDYELVLISDSIDTPRVKDLVQWLRKDFRTAQLPIGVMARGENLDSLRDALVGDPLTTVFPRIHSGEVAAAEVKRLLAQAGRNLTTRDERLDQAAAALDALATLAQSPVRHSQYDLLRQEPNVLAALTTTSLSSQAANVLGMFGTAKAQTALVDFASLSSRPLADRQAAAKAFATAVATRGIMLTTSQITEQFDRYNASETASKETQDVLASILDTIEARAAANKVSTK